MSARGKGGKGLKRTQADKTKALLSAPLHGGIRKSTRLSRRGITAASVAMTVGLAIAAAANPRGTNLSALVRIKGKREHYSQSGDPTLAPFIPRGYTIVGEAATRRQRARKAPTASQVRVGALPSLETIGGQGLHEIVPTNIAGTQAVLNSTPLIYTQSGGRTTPALTPFHMTDDDGNAQIAGHTGTFIKPSGIGTTHTKGQADAHDSLRDAAKGMSSTLSPEAVAVGMVAHHLSLTPPGPAIMQSDYVTGALPNLRAAGGKLEPPGSGSMPHRSTFASIQHDAREASKKRVHAAHAALSPGEQKQVRSPSPLRERMTPTGGGGGYSSSPPALPQLPTFEDAGSDARVAHMAAWMTQPLRITPKKK